MRFIAPKSRYCHIKIMILKRLLHFFNQCMLHKQNTVLNRIARIICFNTCTTTGANLRKIWLETGVDPHISSSKLVTTKLCYHAMPSHEIF